MLEAESGSVERLLGREEEVKRILSYLESPRAYRVLVLVGPIGSGRTTILRYVLSHVSGYHKFHLDASPAAKPLGLPGVEEYLNCFGDVNACIDRVVREGMRIADHRPQEKLLVALDGLVCLRGPYECIVPHIVRGLARFVEAYSDRIRVIVSIDDQEAVLELGRIADYIDVLVVDGLERSAAEELVRREAARAGVSLDEQTVAEIASATGGLPYHIVTVIHEYRGDVHRWISDMWEKLRWKLVLIAAELGVSVRDVAKAMLDLVDKPLSAVPRQSYLLLRWALRNNIVYLAKGTMLKLQLPVYAGILRSIAYGG